MNCRTSTKRKAIRSSKYIAKQKEVVHNLIPLPMEYAKKKKKKGGNSFHSLASVLPNDYIIHSK